MAQEDGNWSSLARSIRDAAWWSGFGLGTSVVCRPVVLTAIERRLRCDYGRIWRGNQSVRYYPLAPARNDSVSLRIPRLEGPGAGPREHAPASVPALSRVGTVTTLPRWFRSKLPEA